MPDRPQTSQSDLKFCPVCREAGERSTIRLSRPYPITCLGWTPYYDEGGRRHAHDPNKRTGEWACSRGHAWIESRALPCPSCDYGSEISIRVVESR